MKERKRLSRLSTEEIFREKIALRQCLWGFFVEVKNGKSLTQEDREHVAEVFELNAEFAEQVFSSISEERSKNSDLVSVLRDEAMEILSARSLKQLKKLKLKFFEKGDYSNEQRRYLKKLYIKRKNRLTA